MLVDHAIQDHFEIVVVLRILLLDVLDGLFDPENLIVSLSHILELSFNAFCKFIRFEQEFAEIQRLLFLNFLVVLVILVLLLYRQQIVLLQVDLTFSFELLKILIQRTVDTLHPVDHNHHENVVRTDPRPNHFIDIISDAYQGTLQYLFVLLVHAHAYSQFHLIVRLLRNLRLFIDFYPCVWNLRQVWFFKQGDKVIEISRLEFFQSVEFRPDRLDSGKFVFVVGDRILDCDHETFGQRILRHGLIVSRGPECYLDRLHEAHIEKILYLDLRHEVANHFPFLVIINHLGSQLLFTTALILPLLKLQTHATPQLKSAINIVIIQDNIAH